MMLMQAMQFLTRGLSLKKLKQELNCSLLHKEECMEYYFLISGKSA